MKAIAEDPELISLVEFIKAGCKLKPRLLAEKLDLSVNNVNNILKRFRRRGRGLI
jgi:hypothetical protein